MHADDISPVVLDLGLPKLSGREAFLRIKQIDDDVKAIFTTGYIKPEMKSQMISAGVLEVIPKPYLPQELAAKIRAVCGKPADARPHGDSFARGPSSTP